MRLRPLSLAAATLAAASLLLAAPAHAEPMVKAASSSGAQITLALATSATPVAADWITISGTAPKSLKGVRLGLDRKEAGKKWGSAGGVKVGKDGSFSIRTRATGVGGYSYRVELPKSKKHKAAKSNNVGVTVFKWYYLSSLTPVANSDYSNSEGSVTMAGATYFQSRLLYGSRYTMLNSTDFNASYKCSSFEATVGIDDTAPAGAAAKDTLLADGTAIASADVALGRTAPMQADISGVFRISVQSAFTTSGSTEAGWGDARMLCSGQP